MRAEPAPTRALFLEDASLRVMDSAVVAVRPLDDGRVAVALEASVFYAEGGGQPGDIGVLRRADGAEAAVLGTVKDKEAPGVLWHLLSADAPDFAVGDLASGALDWARREAHMKMHTALHLLSVAIPLPVTGGSIGAEKSRLDFDMPEAPADKAAVEAELNALIAGDHAVTSEWITDAELEANPQLVKTMAVKPPMGQGRVRLVRIGAGDATVDLQPCGGTHVARTGEIGRIALGKIEKKGRRNRRVSIVFA